MRIGLATPPFPDSLDHAVHTVCTYISQAADFSVDIVCFPAAYVPGIRGKGNVLPRYTQDDLRQAVSTIRQAAATHHVHLVLPMEWPCNAGLFSVVQVISPTGDLCGRQYAIQLAPDQEMYQPGRGRQLFEACGVKFGVVIGQEGWIYPETVRWAASRGARIVFHPQSAGSDTSGHAPRTWADPDGSFHEKALICRGAENTIYFASVNYAFAYQLAATSLIAPDGSCLAHQPYGQSGLLVQKLDMSEANALAAQRFTPERY